MRGKLVAICRVLLVVVLLQPWIVVQQQQPGAGSEAPSNETPSTDHQPAPTASQSGVTSPTFDETVAEAIMKKLSDGLKAHNLSKTRSVFDLPKFGPGFLDNMNAAFNHYDRFECFYHVEKLVPGSGQGEITAQFDLDQQSEQGNFDSRRRHTALKLTVERVPVSGNKHEWRITAMQPPDFLFHF